jgi:hypothetical protein
MLRIDFSNRSTHLPGTGVAAHLNFIARGLVDCESPFTQSNLMSRLKVLDGKSQA